MQSTESTFDARNLFDCSSVGKQWSISLWKSLGANYCDLPLKVEINSLPFCQQCENAKLDRLAVGRESLHRESASYVPTSPEESLFSVVDPLNIDDRKSLACSADGHTPNFLNDEFGDWEPM